MSVLCIRRDVGGSSEAMGEGGGGFVGCVAMDTKRC